MKATGLILRVVALLLLILLSIMVVSNYSLSATMLQETVENYEEEYDEHKDNEYHDEDDCWRCEDYDDDMKRYEQYATQYILNAVETLLQYAVYCIILFGVGAIVSQIGTTKKPAAPGVTGAVLYAAPTTDFCISCGNKRQGGDRFCAICGTAYKD